MSGMGLRSRKVIPVESKLCPCYPHTIQITVQLPDDFAQHANPGRGALESLAIEGYRTGTLSHYYASQLLGMERLEFDGFLNERNVMEHAYDVEDFDADCATLHRLEIEGLSRA